MHDAHGVRDIDVFALSIRATEPVDGFAGSRLVERILQCADMDIGPALFRDSLELTRDFGARAKRSCDDEAASWPRPLPTHGRKSHSYLPGIVFSTALTAMQRGVYGANS